MKRRFGSIQRVFVFFSIGLCLCTLVTLSHADQGAKVDEYLNMLRSGSSGSRVDALKYISRSGLTDPELFDFLEQKLLKEFLLNNGDPKHIDEMAWLCKALASSGNDAYRGTLEKVLKESSDFKIKKYARQSIDSISEYAIKNRLIAEKSSQTSGLDPQDAKFMALLESGRTSMIKDAAKGLSRGRATAKIVYDKANEVLLEMLADTSPDNQQVDTMAWLCKALGASGISEYRETLDRVIDSTSIHKLKNYAMRSRQRL